MLRQAGTVLRQPRNGQERTGADRSGKSAQVAQVDIEDFYRSRAWLKRREAVLRRDGYQCQRCRRYGKIAQASTVHHVQHLEDRPDLALSPGNLISVCTACHNALHPEKQKNRRGGGAPSDFRG